MRECTIIRLQSYEKKMIFANFNEEKNAFWRRKVISSRKIGVWVSIGRGISPTDGTNLTDVRGEKREDASKLIDAPSHHEKNSYSFVISQVWLRLFMFSQS